MLINSRLALDNLVILDLDTNLEIRICKEIHLVKFSRILLQCSSNLLMHLQERQEINLHHSILWSCFRILVADKILQEMLEVSQLPSIQCNYSKIWESICHKCSHKVQQWLILILTLMPHKLNLNNNRRHSLKLSPHNSPKLRLLMPNQLRHSQMWP